MTALQLKKELLQLITGIDDVESLIKLKETAHSLYPDKDGLSAAQVIALENSIKDLESENLVSNEDVFKKSSIIINKTKV